MSALERLVKKYVTVKDTPPTDLEAAILSAWGKYAAGYGINAECTARVDQYENAAAELEQLQADRAALKVAQETIKTQQKEMGRVADAWWTQEKKIAALEAERMAAK
jgi:hypothetical protein